jgi:hypothetical protein
MDLISKLTDEIDELRRLRIKSSHVTKNFTAPPLNPLNSNHAVNNQRTSELNAETTIRSLMLVVASQLQAHSALSSGLACFRFQRMVAQCSKNEADPSQDHLSLHGCLERLKIEARASSIARAISDPGYLFCFSSSDSIPSYIQQQQPFPPTAASAVLPPHDQHQHMSYDPGESDLVACDDDLYQAWGDIDDKQMDIEDVEKLKEFPIPPAPVSNPPKIHSLVFSPQHPLPCSGTLIRPLIKPTLCKPQLPPLLPRPDSDDNIEDEIEEVPGPAADCLTAPRPLIISRKRTFLSRSLDTVEAISESEEQEIPAAGPFSLVERAGESIFSLQNLDLPSAPLASNTAKNKRNYRPTFNPQTLLTSATDISNELSAHDEDRFLQQLLGNHYVAEPRIIELDDMDDDDFAAIDAAVAMHLCQKEAIASAQEAISDMVSEASSDAAPMIDNCPSNDVVPLSSQRNLHSEQKPSAWQDMEEEILIDVAHEEEFFTLEDNLDQQCEIFSSSQADADANPPDECLLHSDCYEIEANNEQMEMGRSAGLSIENQRSIAQRRIIQEIQAMKKSVIDRRARGMSTFITECLSSCSTFDEILAKSQSEATFDFGPNRMFVSLLNAINNQGIRLYHD